MTLLCDPEVAALLVAHRSLARTLRPLCNALSMPPLPCLAAPRRRKPEPDPANPDATGFLAKPPRKPRRRKFRFRRNEDLLFHLRMGKPVPEF